MLIEVNLAHPSNALSAIDVTLSGMMTDVNPVHPKKAAKRIDFTP